MFKFVTDKSVTEQAEAQSSAIVFSKDMSLPKSSPLYLIIGQQTRRISCPKTLDKLITILNSMAAVPSCFVLRYEDEEKVIITMDSELEFTEFLQLQISRLQIRVDLAQDGEEGAFVKKMPAPAAPAAPLEKKASVVSSIEDSPVIVPSAPPSTPGVLPSTPGVDGKDEIKQQRQEAFCIETIKTMITSAAEDKAGTKVASPAESGMPALSLAGDSKRITSLPTPPDAPTDAPPSFTKTEIKTEEIKRKSAEDKARIETLVQLYNSTDYYPTLRKIVFDLGYSTSHQIALIVKELQYYSSTRHKLELSTIIARVLDVLQQQ